MDIAVFAEFINLTAPIVISEKKQFHNDCGTLKLSSLMNVSEEAFAFLLMENCFKQWKWIATENVKKILCSNVPVSPSSLSSSSSFSSSNKNSTPSTAHVENQETGNQSDEGISSSSTTVSSPDSSTATAASKNHTPQSRTISLQGSSGGKGYQHALGDDDDDDDDDVDEDEDTHENCTQVGPGYLYQLQQVRKDGRLGAGPWLPEGMIRYNEIVECIIKERKVRSKFEEHLKSYFSEQNEKDPSRKKKKRKRGKDDDKDGTMKVVVIDLFSSTSDNDEDED